MRLDHFVLHNNHLTTTKGDTMSNNALSTPSITHSRGFDSSHLTWTKTMQKSMNTLVHGRIKDTGTNFIVEGWSVRSGTNRTEWVRIPCQNLATAQMYLISIMDKQSFSAEQLRQRLDRAKNDKLAQEILATL